MRQTELIDKEWILVINEPASSGTSFASGSLAVGPARVESNNFSTGRGKSLIL